MTMATILERQLTRRQVLVAGVAGASAVVLVACGASATPTPGVGGSSGPVTVKMTDDMKFDPAAVTIKVGDTIHWDNSSSMVHSSTDDPSKAATAADAVLPTGATPWDSGLLNPGQTFDHTFTVAGDYHYFCIPHESVGMLGTVTVQAA